MAKIDYIKVIEECERHSNAELFETIKMLEAEFEETKKMLFQLSEHLDKVEASHKKITEEIKKRSGK